MTSGRLSRIWFVSRHPGAVEWVRAQRLPIDRWVAHLNVAEVAAGDTVIGTLPVHLAAEVCRLGARYVHLVLTLEKDFRGRELSAGELAGAGAVLRQFHVQEIAPCSRV